jgi:hypothetical protein
MKKEREKKRECTRIMRIESHFVHCLYLLGEFLPAKDGSVEQLAPLPHGKTPSSTICMDADC